MATIKPTTVPSKRLSESITGSSLTFKLNNIEGWDGNDLTSADFGSKLYAVFRNSAGTLMEIMEVDPTTITAATSPITILLRGLKFDGDLTTEVSANKLTWVKGDTIVELGTHVPQLFKSYVDALGDQTVAGVKTFSSFPVKSGTTTPTAAGEFVTKAYADLLAGGIAVTNQLLVTAVASTTITAGQTVRMVLSGGSSGRWTLLDADDEDALEGRVGIAQNSTTSGNSVTVLLNGLDSNQTGLTAGAIYYASNTAGAISTTPGTYKIVIGRAQTTTTLIVDPLANQELATIDGSKVYAADSVGTDSYAITLPVSPIAYKAGMVFNFKVGTANTGAATLNVNAIGAITIKKSLDVDLETGDIKANQIAQVIYDGTNFQLLSPTSKAKVSQDGSEVYAADAGANDTYAVTLSPVPTAYATGMVVRFKANTANTGAATLNVNALGAKTIKKKTDVDLDSNDIKANQLVEVIYDGTNFQLLSQISNQISIQGTGATTYDMSTATGTQNIAHGLGVIPKLFRISAVSPTGFVAFSYNSSYISNGDGSSSTIGQTSSNFRLVFTASNYQTATITADATNIILSWTKTGTPTGNISLIWEAVA